MEIYKAIKSYEELSKDEREQLYKSLFILGTSFIYYQWTMNNRRKYTIEDKDIFSKEIKKTFNFMKKYNIVAPMDNTSVKDKLLKSYPELSRIDSNHFDAVLFLIKGMQIIGIDQRTFIPSMTEIILNNGLSNLEGFIFDVLNNSLKNNLGNGKKQDKLPITRSAHHYLPLFTLLLNNDNGHCYKNKMPVLHARNNRALAVELEANATPYDTFKGSDGNKKFYTSNTPPNIVERSSANETIRTEEDYKICCDLMDAWIHNEEIYEHALVNTSFLNIPLDFYNYY